MTQLWLLCFHSYGFHSKLLLEYSASTFQTLRLCFVRLLRKCLESPSDIFRPRPVIFPRKARRILDKVLEMHFEMFREGFAILCMFDSSSTTGNMWQHTCVLSWSLFLKQLTKHIKTLCDHGGKLSL